MFSGARGAKPQAHHGPLQRLLDGAADVSLLCVIASAAFLPRRGFHQPYAVSCHEKEHADLVKGQGIQVGLRTSAQSVNFGVRHCGAEFLQARSIPCGALSCHVAIVSPIGSVFVLAPAPDATSNGEVEGPACSG
jgi:hypothetical protein